MDKIQLQITATDRAAKAVRKTRRLMWRRRLRQWLCGKLGGHRFKITDTPSWTRKVCNRCGCTVLITKPWLSLVVANHDAVLRSFLIERDTMRDTMLDTPEGALFCEIDANDV